MRLSLDVMPLLSSQTLIVFDLQPSMAIVSRRWKSRNSVMRRCSSLTLLRQGLKMTALKYTIEQGSRDSLRTPIGPPSAGDSQKLVRRPTYFGWRRLHTGESTQRLYSTEKVLSRVNAVAICLSPYQPSPVNSDQPGHEAW